MNKFKRYAIRLGIALSAFLVSLFVYLMVPPLSSSIRDVPHEAPVAFVPDKQNKGERCLPETIYVDKQYQIADHEVIHPFCADVQEKFAEAASEGNIAEMRALLARGANLSSSGVTELAEPIGSPLPLAARSGHWDAVRFLLDNGGDVNDEYICCVTRASLLILAVDQHNVDAVRLLLARGADVRLTDFAGETAFEAAARKGYADVAQLFDEAGCLTWTQRAELRIAKLPGMNLERAYAAFTKLGLVKKINPL